MTRFTLNLTIAALSAALLTGCSIDTMSSHDVVPSAVYQDYSATYYKESDRTELRAQFRAGGPTGTTLHLDAPAKVRANGKHLSSRTFLGTYYVETFAGLQNTVNFEWTDSQEKVYANSIGLKPIEVVEAAATLSARQPYQIVVSGPTLMNGEDARVELQQEGRASDGSLDLLFVRKSIKAGNRITISPAEMAKLREGAAHLNREPRTQFEPAQCHCPRRHDLIKVCRRSNSCYDRGFFFITLFGTEIDYENLASRKSAIENPSSAPPLKSWRRRAFAKLRCARWRSEQASLNLSFTITFRPKIICW